MLKNACCRTRTVSSRCLEPFRKHESQEDKGCVNCCHQSLTKPLITGFVEIAKSRRLFRRAIELFVFFVCSAGYLYQTSSFLQIYLHYPTSQLRSEEYPEEITAPAITICNTNRLFRQRICELFPEDCTIENTTTSEDRCNSDNRRCIDMNFKWYKFKDLDFTSPGFYGRHKWDRRNSLLNAMGPQKEADVIHDCILSINGTRSSCNSSIMIQAAKGGFPYTCFSFLSSLGKPTKELLKLSVSDVYFFNLNMQPEQYINDNDLVEASIVLHDPRKLVNPMTEGVPLRAGKHYKFYPTMYQKVSLPPPYASKCEDYLNEWKKNGGNGPLSKKDCIDLCVIKEMVDTYGCVAQQITYPNNYEICLSSGQDATPEMLKKCSKICRDACEENSYSLTSYTVMEASSFTCEQEDRMCINGHLSFEVFFNWITVQKFQHIPRIESIELFSYMGGYLGMWLGISLASLFDFGEMIYDTVYPFLKGKGEKKTTTPTEKF